MESFYFVSYFAILFVAIDRRSNLINYRDNLIPSLALLVITLFTLYQPPLSVSLDPL